MSHQQPRTPVTLAFDVYGTLIDTGGVTSILQSMVGDLATRFSSRWREKQLEYSFRRGLMGQYVDFSVCTRNALDYTCAELGADLTETQRRALMDSYRSLPPFADVLPALQQLQQQNCRLYAFSNGRGQDVDRLLRYAGIRELLLDVVSVHEVASFKPDPAVYRHFLSRTASAAEHSRMISGNPFDILGAAACGIGTIWVKRRADALFDPWEEQPDQVINSLSQLPRCLEQ